MPHHQLGTTSRGRHTPAPHRHGHSLPETRASCSYPPKLSWWKPQYKQSARKRGLFFAAPVAISCRSPNRLDPPLPYLARATHNTSPSPGPQFQEFMGKTIVPRPRNAPLLPCFGRHSPAGKDDAAPRETGHLGYEVTLEFPVQLPHIPAICGCLFPFRAVRPAQGDVGKGSV